jgi:hypothetical protein
LIAAQNGSDIKFLGQNAVEDQIDANDSTPHIGGDRRA